MDMHMLIEENWGDIMFRQGLRFVVGMAILIGVVTIVTMQSIPKSEVMVCVGDFLTGESLLCMKDGQEEKLVSELFGGQQYMCMEEGEGLQEKLILEENAQIYEQAEENEEPLVGDIEAMKANKEAVKSIAPVTRQKNPLVEQLRENMDTDFLWKNFYIVDSTTSVTKNIFDVKQMLQMDMKMRKQKGKKQILIYHTHGASESFKDSRKGVVEDSVVGVGDSLANELEKRGYGVYHDRTQYDRVNGGINRSFAYNQSLDGITKIKNANKDIQVIIDLHRDSVGKGKHTYTTIQGRKTAIVMFFNGMSRTKSGEIDYLYNPNLKSNLAFSLQLKCKAMEYYDGFTKPIYLKGYRYNLHLLPKSLLIELGNENNTVVEAKNAAIPLADVLDKVLSGEG